MCESKLREIVFNGIVSTEGVKIKEAGCNQEVHKYKTANVIKIFHESLQSISNKVKKTLTKRSHSHPLSAAKPHHLHLHHHLLTCTAYTIIVNHKQIG